MPEEENERQHTTRAQPSEEILRALYSAQWQDIHHSRAQDWRFCNIIIVGLVGIGSLKVLGEHPVLQRVGALLFAVISLLAIGITLRHRDLFNEKMDAIRKLEKLLYAPDLFQKRKDLKSRLFKVQYFLIVLYFVFFCFFVYIGVFGTDTVP